MDLTNSVAIVTGGAQGIGKGITLALIERNAKVVIADLNEELGKNFEEEQGRDKLLFVKCDVTKNEELNSLFETTEQTFGKVNIVCNNAGIMSSDENKTRAMVNVNVTAVLEGTFKATEVMSKKQGGNGGVVINIASAAGIGRLPGAPVYSATKAAVVTFTSSFEFLPFMVTDGIRVNCICPTFVDTEMVRKGSEENPKMKYLIEKYGGCLSVDLVVKATMQTIEDKTMNAAILMITAPDNIIQVEPPKARPMK